MQILKLLLKKPQNCLLLMLKILSVRDLVKKRGAALHYAREQHGKSTKYLHAQKIKNQAEGEEGEAIRCVKIRERNVFIGHSAYPCNGFEGILRTTRQGDLSDLLRELPSSNNSAANAVGIAMGSLEYIIDIRNRYNHALDFNGKESDDHGLCHGF
jgi:hypothetical protein